MKQPQRTLTALAAAAALILTGCGSDSSDATDEATPIDSATTSETPSDSAPPSESATTSPSPTKSKQATTAAVSLDVLVDGDEVTPVAEKVEIKVGETVELRVDSDRVGELHVHSTPEQTFEITPGKDVVLITLDKPGTVDVEEHESDVLVARILVR